MFFNLTVNGQSDYTYQTSFPIKWAWRLSSISDVTTYEFDMNIESSDIEVVNNFTLTQNYNKYPSYKFGNQKYRKGSLSTMPYTYSHVTNLYTIDVDLLNDLMAFLNDKKMKVLQIPDGSSMKVVTVNPSYKYLDNIKETPYTVKFSYIEVSNVA